MLKFIQEGLTAFNDPNSMIRHVNIQKIHGDNNARSTFWFITVYYNRGFSRDYFGAAPVDNAASIPRTISLGRGC